MRKPLLRHSGGGRNPACHTVPRSGQGRIAGVVPLRGILSVVWIPAFAGMTVVENVRLMIYVKLISATAPPVL